jgi:hypothetical protein
MNSDRVRRRRYRLVLRAELGDRFGFLFEGMQMERLAGATVLTGAVADQAQLLGPMERIAEPGVELVCIETVDGPAAQAPGLATEGTRRDGAEDTACCDQRRWAWGGANGPVAGGR